MSIIKSLVIAFSMYSKIPMPHLELDEKDMKYVMGFFPLIGLITGALAYGWIYAGKILYVPDISSILSKNGLRIIFCILQISLLT